MRLIPLPFTCHHERWQAGADDDHGNPTSSWQDPVEVPCVWWSPASNEPASGSGDRVSAAVVLVVDSDVEVDHRDRFTVDGRRFEVIGLPKDYDHGPWGFTPKRRVVELKWMA